MSDSTYNQDDEQIKYSKLLSKLFGSVFALALLILCLLNNLSLDFYVMLVVLKIVIPAFLCFWFIGFSIGRILDNFSGKVKTEKVKNEKIAYEMPSMFSADAAVNDDEFGGLI